MTKVCTKCGVEKDETEFTYNKTLGYYAGECKVCKSAYLKAWRLANRDRLIQFDKDRYAANPEFKRGLASQWVKDNPEQHNANTKRWRDSNPDKQHAMEKAWRQANPGAWILKDQRRRARLYGDEDSGVYDFRDWLLFKEECGNVCLCCGRSGYDVKLTIDHVIPLVLGGKNVLDNFQMLCRNCNSAKGTKTTDYRNVTHKAAAARISNLSAARIESGCEAGDTEVTSMSPQPI